MSKYSQGKIYKLTSSQTDKVYIGSTTRTLTKRLSQHKSSFKRWKNGKYSYTSSYELIKYDDVYIELLELCPCESRKELEKEEGKLIIENNCVNKYVVGRTKKEYDKIYRHKNKEKIKERQKEYVEANKEKINEQSKKKYDCECGGKYTHQVKSRHLKTKKHQAYILNVEKLT